MRPCISIRRSVRPSVGPSVRPSAHPLVHPSVRRSVHNAFVSNTRNRVISVPEVEGMSRERRKRMDGRGVRRWWGGREGGVEGGGRIYRSVLIAWPNLTIAQNYRVIKKYVLQFSYCMFQHFLAYFSNSIHAWLKHRVKGFPNHFWIVKLAKKSILLAL